MISDRTSCDAEQDVLLELTQTGPPFTGTLTSRVRKLWNPCDQIGFIASAPISGTAGAGTLSFSGPGDPGRDRVIVFSGTLTATPMTLTAGSSAVLTLNRQ